MLREKRLLSRNGWRPTTTYRDLDRDCRYYIWSDYSALNHLDTRQNATKLKISCGMYESE
jgi:hypothetical protein